MFSSEPHVRTEPCRSVFVHSYLNSQIFLLSWARIFWKPFSMMGNDKLWKANQALGNEIKELKNDDLSKNQHVSIRSLKVARLDIFGGIPPKFEH